MQSPPASNHVNSPDFRTTLVTICALQFPLNKYNIYKFCLF